MSDLDGFLHVFVDSSLVLQLLFLLFKELFCVFGFVNLRIGLWIFDLFSSLFLFGIYCLLFEHGESLFV